MRILIVNVIYLTLYFLGQASAAVQNDPKSFIVRFLFSFPESSIRNSPLSQPQAISIAPEGQVFVLDSGNNRILQFDKNGAFLYSIGGFGWKKEEFDRPLDVSAKTSLDIFIADYNNERIERYDKNLNHISSLYSDDTISRTLQFGFPSSVDISRHGELFICDNENDRILKINSFGEPELSFGDFNWGEGQLRYPVKIELTPTDLVYVSDQGTNQIVIFDYYGNYLARFGSGILNKPNGLAWTQEKELFVADTGNDRIVVFDKDHKLIFSWGEEGDKIGAFDNPVDVVIYDNRVYVLDSGNGRVQVFKLEKFD